MVVLAATMLLFGGQTLIEGLLTVRDPKAIVRLVGNSQARTPLEEESQRKLEPIRDAIVARHRLALRVDAVASIGLGLFVLYAAAAALSRDRNGRRLALLTACFGFAFFAGLAAPVGADGPGDGGRGWAVAVRDRRQRGAGRGPQLDPARDGGRGAPAAARGRRASAGACCCSSTSAAGAAASSTALPARRDPSGV